MLQVKFEKVIKSEVSADCLNIMIPLGSA